MEKYPLIRGGVSIGAVVGVSTLIHNVLKIAVGNVRTPQARGGWQHIPLSELQQSDLEMHTVEIQTDTQN